MTATSPSRIAPKPPNWLAKAKRWVYPYRPRFEERRFWAIQGLVLLVAVVHTTLEALEIHEVIALEALYFVPPALFLLPVLYAALNFGYAGSVATALWSVALSMPNWIWFHAGAERLGCIFQVGAVVGIAVFVGRRVEREIASRQQAGRVRAALVASEAKYRGLFQSSPVAILILNQSDEIVEANPAAGALFGRKLEALRGMTVAELVGSTGAQQLLNSPGHDNRRRAYLALKPGDDSKLHLESTVTRIDDGEGNPVTQVLLRDITEEQQRQAGLRTYAAHVLRAQEEERKRIAQELHDDAVQELVTLCRKLDTAEGTSNPLPSSVIETLGQARRSAEEVVQKLRGFASALRPPTLDDLGLVTSIRRLLVDLTERVEIQGQIRVVGKELRLPPDVELGLFRIAQEALRNIERHAQATHASVIITFDGENGRLDVVDDGVGFIVPPVPADFAAHLHLGIMGMQERAELLGGSLEIQSSPGKGTRIAVSIPVH